MKFYIFPTFILLTLTSCAYENRLELNSTAAKPKQTVGYAFDWDDNIFNMPTKIILFNKVTGEKKLLTTAEFALARAQIGKPGTEWVDYEFRSDLKDGSLQYFTDHSAEGSAVFYNDIQRAMKDNPNWRGPVWKNFVAAMEKSSTAETTWIITARLHNPKTMVDALAKLKERQFFKNIPLEENVFPVAYPGFADLYKKKYGEEPPAGGAENPSPRKAAVMEKILDQMNETPLPEGGFKTLQPSGEGYTVMHTWGFSDDDFGNYSKAVEVLQRGIDAGRWQKVKIAVFFTGTNHPTEKPRAVVLRANAKPRDFGNKENL